MRSTRIGKAAPTALGSRSNNQFISLDSMELPNLWVDPVQQSSVRRICIIGAGPAGLAALQAVLDSPQYHAGLWIPTAFETRENVGGVWLPSPGPVSDQPPPTPLYDSLTTNLAHPTMAYTDFPFPKSTNLFPKADTVCRYLEAYADHFDLRRHIFFNTRVVSTDYIASKSTSTSLSHEWVVRTQPSMSSASIPTSHQFDWLLVCNGHHNVPRYPNTVGLASWLSSGKASHSMFYRHPSAKYGDMVLVVGAGPSGQDIVHDLLEAPNVKTVIHSTSNPPPLDATNDRVKHRSRISRFLPNGSVEFSDGTTEEGIQHCILATGYEVSLPFFSSFSSAFTIKQGIPPSVPPLPRDIYNTTYGVFPLARHLFPFPSALSASGTAAHISIAFPGLLVRVVPFPLIQLQARVALAAFASSSYPSSSSAQHGAENGTVDWTAEAVDIVGRYEALRTKVGLDDVNSVSEEEKIAKQWHRFEPMEQFDYRDALIDFIIGLQGPIKADIERYRPKSWERDLYARKDLLRRTWRELEAVGEAEEWVKDVDTEEEWVGLMWRLVRKGEGEEGKAKL
ncbi:hypothetical protein B0H34DRAFT_714240 [Crassisporium funariophilum]|nr:hypothetical protein B0H34DRAFT_714240 [Crassisporium funariophilum]